MSVKQQWTLGLGLALIVIMGIFPPWSSSWWFYVGQPRIYSAPTSYAFIATPPAPPTPAQIGLTDPDTPIKPYCKIALDWSRLTAQWLVVLALIIGGMVWFAEPKSRAILQ